MEVFDRQKLRLPALEPLGTRHGLALGAVAIAAGVVGVMRESAAVAFFDMAAECRGAADLHGAHDAKLRQRQEVRRAVIRAMLSENVGHFESGSGPPNYFRGFGFGWRTSMSSALGVPATTCDATFRKRAVVERRLSPNSA